MKLDEDRVRRAIAEAFPSLKTRDARYFAAGWDYELWQIDNDLLVRFPLRPECADPLRVEARLLPALAKRLSVRIPRPTLFTEGCESFPLPFLAYHKVPGTPLAEAGPDQSSLLSVGGQAGRFLAELHSFPVAEAARAGVPAYTAEGWRTWYVEFYDKLRATSFPLVPPDVASVADSFWRAFLDDHAFFRFEPVLIHRDLDMAHLLVEGTILTGVIDFADACVGDPALDFAGCDGAFRSRALAAYGADTTEADRLSGRADIYRTRISPFHALIYGIEIDDSGWRDRAIEAIRGWED